jgi:hypothetical protein
MFRRDLTRYPILFIPCPRQHYSNRLLHGTGLSPSAGSQHLQTRDLAPDLKPNIPYFRRPLPWLASRQRPTRDTLHLRPSQFPLGTMSTEHRSLELICYGRVRGWGIAG